MLIVKEIKVWWPRHPVKNMFRFAYGLLLLLLATQFITQAADSTTIHPRGEPSTDGSSTSKRTLFSVIWGCASTTIICAWAAIHPNIPPREGPIKRALRKVELMFWTIMTPEMLPTWALNQRLGAMTVRDVYNEKKGVSSWLLQGIVHQQRSGDKEDGMQSKWDKIRSWFSFDERQESTGKSGYLSCIF